MQSEEEETDMHPTQADIYIRSELDTRRRAAPPRRPSRPVRAGWATRTGSLLIAFGERAAATGRRLEARAPAAPCLDAC